MGILDEFKLAFGDAYREPTEEEMKRHEEFKLGEQERIIERLVRIFEHDTELLAENPNLEYFGDAPNHYAEYYLNEAVWNRARDIFFKNRSNND